MTIHSLPDITAATNPTAMPLLATPGTRARKILLSNSLNSTLCRVGDFNVGVSRGLIIGGVGAEVSINASEADPTDSIDLNQVYVYVGAGFLGQVTVSYLL